ncbi:peptide chain release factor N(5)-glutamine methyltransferase [Rudaea sp.]|uniref:peptide chain release factor N(5)-glutamine methyltransferase n=1 Tax=Rudaea sp. TaxID=2136325 RepID=UPI003220547A
MSASTVRALLADATAVLAHADAGARFTEPALASPASKRGRNELRPCEDSAEARREAELLLQHALRVDRAWLFAHADDEVAVVLAGQFHCYVSRRATGEPLAYITGRREFFSLDLVVTPDVLIPRAETELLVEAALEKIPRDMQVRIADLGTGSGAIALALAHERPQAHVLAVDASAAALALARENARRLGLANVEFAESDWFAALAGRKFDVVVSNPPYIARGDAHLEQGDLRFEPALALSSGADGLDAIRTIARDARVHLAPGGWLLFEHGYDQGAAVRDILAAHGYAHAATLRDLEGRDRVSRASRDGARAMLDQVGQ